MANINVCWYCGERMVSPAVRDPKRLPLVGDVPVQTYRITCKRCGAGYHMEMMLDAPPKLSPEAISKVANRPS